MNILYINHYAGGPKYGMEFRPFGLAKEWAAAGHRVTIVAASESHLRWQKPVLESSYTEEWVDGIRYIWCRTSAIQRLFPCNQHFFLSLSALDHPPPVARQARRRDCLERLQPRYLSGAAHRAKT
jgi:hypothetical protein